MYPRLCCSGKAGHHPGQTEISERGNRNDIAVPCVGHAHRRRMVSMRGGVLVVVGGRESRSHGEGGQQGGSERGKEEAWH